MRAAVVGVGMIGSLHAHVYAEHPATELVAVCDASPERAREVGDRLGASWYADVDELLAREEVDVATVATPVQARLAAACACAQRGSTCCSRSRSRRRSPRSTSPSPSSRRQE